MLKKGPAKKVTIYLNEDTRAQHHGPLYQTVMEFLFNKGVSGATLIRPHSGFGPHRRMRSPDTEASMTELPIRVEFIDTPEKVERLMPLLYDLVTDGLIEVQDAVIVKAVSQDEAAEAPLAKHREARPAKMLRVFLGEADQWEGEPLYDAIVKRLRMLEVAGATVYRGILGYGAKGRTHKEGFFHLSRDLPIMISVVDSPEKIDEAIAAVEAMLGDGLIVISDVDTIRFVHTLPKEAPDGSR